MESTFEQQLTPEQMDTIGEIMNISMGSAATAVSTMLEKQVTITTPRLIQEQFKNIDSSSLEPALLVKINYVSGIEGTNVIMIRSHDMQVMLDLLMGNDISTSVGDVEFDDMSLSAACEVMNQMMGSSATALSEILNMPVNISTPEAFLCENKDSVTSDFWNIDDEDSVVAISFQMMIKDVLDTTFTCFLSTELVIKMISHINATVEEETNTVTAPKTETISAPNMEITNQFEQTTTEKTQVETTQANTSVLNGQNVGTAINQNLTSPTETTQQTVPSPQNQMGVIGAQMQNNQEPIEGQNYGMPPQMAYPPNAYPPNGYPPNGYPPYGQFPPQYYMPPQGYPQQQGQAYGKQTPPITAQKVEYPNFAQQPFQAENPSASNIGLLMGVQLEVSVIVGRTKRKIKDILDFGQGTVVELDTQTGAPAELVVNGQLLAYGDVVVVGDNFGLRITEIVGTKELLDSLGANGTL